MLRRLVPTGAAGAARAVGAARWLQTAQADPVTLRRALLYLPGNDVRKAEKAVGLNVDCVCLDCEDAVAFNRKEEARKTVCELLNTMNFRGADVAVRINPLMTELAEADLEAIFRNERQPNTLVVPKVESAAELTWLFDLVEEICNDLPDPENMVKVLVQIESPRGVLNLNDILRMDVSEVTESYVLKTDGVIFGSDDYAASIGATRTKGANELIYARQAVVTHAKAYDLQAIDMVNINYNDLVHLKEESRAGADMGFTGKQIIHPNQVEIVQQEFSPSAERIKYALELEAAFNKHQESGQGAFTFRDQMIDRPTMIQCQNVLALARRTGLGGVAQEANPKADQTKADKPKADPTGTE